MSSEGNAGQNGGPAGDLYVFITVLKHRHFKRQGNNIYLELELPFTQAALGTEIAVPTLEGIAKLKVPAGSQSDTVLRLKNKGLSPLRGFGKGSLYVKIKVVIPKSLSSKEKELVEQIAKIRNEDTQPKDIYSRLI